MANKSKIEWTDATWNPIRGCSRVSEGCRHCYAERVAARFSGPGMLYEGLVKIMDRTTCGPGEKKHSFVSKWTGEVRFIEEHLADPLHWKKPCRVFVNSMSDLFHEKVQDEWINRIFAIMAASPRHTFQILTKRPKEMLAWAHDVESRVPRDGCNPWLINWPGLGGESITSQWPLPNVWLGVSVEDQKTADERIPLLLQTPASVRWVSYEPALGPINLQCIKESCEDHDNYFDAIGGIRSIRPCLDWIVCGGESGLGARPMHPDWARLVREQCQHAKVPFFFKQWGEWEPINTALGLVMERVGKKRAGRLLDGREWNEFPNITEAQR